MKTKLAQWSPVTWILGLFLVVGIFLRFWNFTGTLQFLGDQGRDALTLLHLYRDHDVVLIGPVTSTGNMYLGPLYYYFMAPFQMLTQPSPLGPAYVIAILSLATILLIYFLGKELVGKVPALIAAGCFTISATVISFSRFSWNPNPAPFVAMIMFWASYRAWTKNPWYWVVVSICAAVLMQLHYVTLLATVGAGVIWLIQVVQMWRAKKSFKFWRPLLAATVVSIGVFIAFATPLVIFDLRHEFLNVQSFQKLISPDQGNFNSVGNSSKLVRVLKETHGRSMQILFEMFIGKNRSLNTILTAATLLGFGWLSSRKKGGKYQRGYQVLLVYLVIAIFGLSFYQSTVFYHYVAYLFPVTFLIYGVLLEYIAQHPIGKGVGVAFLAGFTYWNLTNLPFKPLGWTVDDIQKTAAIIQQKVQPGEKYNIVLLTGTGDIEGQNYRYFLEASDKPPLPKEQWGDTETLFIINEDKKLERVVDSPIYEIVVFPNKTPAEVYTIPNGPEITVLKK